MCAIGGEVIFILIVIAPMIQSARAAITNTENEQAQAEFSQKSDNVSIDI